MAFRHLVHIVLLSVCWLWSPGVRAQTCDIPHPGAESLDSEITIRDSGEAVYNGMVVPRATYLRWHMRATAFGHCEARGGPECDFFFNDYRGVAKIAVDSTLDTTSFRGSGAYFYIYGKDDGNPATDFPQVVDTHDLTTTNGPRETLLYSPGSYTFQVVNIIYETICPLLPDELEEAPFTIYVHDFSNDENLGCGKNGTTVGNPCHVKTGNKYQREVDTSGNALPIVRHYNSQLTSIDFGLGRGWLTPYLRRLEVYPTSTGAKAHYRRGDGYGEQFSRTGATWAAESDSSAKLVEDSTGYTVTDLTRSRDRFDLNGRLLESTDETGSTVELTYDTNGKLTSVVDDYGHQLIFTYNSGGRVASINRGGNLYSFTYDTIAGNLTRITYPDGTTRDYLYENTSHPHHLTGIVDENGTRWGTYTYDSSGRATASQHPGGAEDVSLAYSSSSATSVTDALGVARTFNHSNIKGAYRITAVSGASCSWCTADKATTYDANANVTSRTDWSNRKTCYAYDLARNLETVRLEGLAPSMSCPSNLVTYTPAVGTPQRKITTQWHATHPLPVQIDDSGRRTTYTYDTAGYQLTRTKLDIATAESRTWTYTYDGDHRMLTSDGPRADVSDVTTYTYYSCNTGYQCGQVNTITNALGHVRTFDTYNAHGQPLTITEPNGVVTTLTYDLRQRLTSRTVGTEQTTFEYWPTGLLKKTTLPDGSYLEYTYDAAHRLTQINDAEGNRVQYTLDAMGNRTAEEVFDPSNALTGKRTQVFNALNQLWKQIGAAGGTQVTTTFGYDANGNPTSIAAPLGRNTAQTYDGLNRLNTTTDPENGLTAYGYNVLDELISVTDPKGLTTSYTYNALGDLKQQISPDTGTTTNTFDSAGNLRTSTDARNKTATYAYDGLNRVTSVTYADQVIGYTYDTGTNQKGRLSQLTDNSGATSWTYDVQGRVLSRQQTMGSITKSVGYAYDASGRLQTLTLPSGNTVTLGYANGKIASLTVDGTMTVLSNARYSPFGPTTGWTWGNSTLAVREYDEDGKITLTDSAGLKSYSHDDAFRITGITDASDPNLAQSYDYDLLDRLTSATGTSLNQTWTYDANGNRLTQGGSQASTYTVSTTSNRINAITGSLTRTYGYDNAGNTTSDGSAAYTYNDAGRMISVTKAGVNSTYSLNGLGQRVRKTTSGVSIYFVYDEAGRLIGEYDSAGNLITETIWFGDIPVAVLKPNGGSGVNVFYIHSDHLNTPRKITRPSDNAIVWRWDSDPFGTTLANENPSGLGAFGYQPRFPGQYFDSEVGLHYNYFRDYDPAVGRYVQSDPMGLWDGVNTYGYVHANPVSKIDPSGLGGAGAAPPTPSTGEVEVSVRCGGLPALMGGSSGGVHCEVVAVCKKTGESVAFGIGGGGDGIWDRLFGGLTPPRYQNPAPRVPPSGVTQYTATCGGGQCDGCEALECFKKMHNGNTPPPYYALWQNSNEYAHSLLNQCGCRINGMRGPPGAVAW